MEIYLVGGSVRDRLLNVDCDDWDFSVQTPDDVPSESKYRYMVDTLVADGFHIYQENEKYFSCKVKFPDTHPFAKLWNNKPNTKTADFTHVRTDGVYVDGRRPESVQPADLVDDLARRDFSINAIAETETGVLFDPFGGVKDLQDGIIDTVIDAETSFTQDALRALRALRFAITKHTVDGREFRLSDSVRNAIEIAPVLDSITNNSVSSDRVMSELNKMFAHDVVRSMKLLSEFPRLSSSIFNDTVVNLFASAKKR